MLQHPEERVQEKPDIYYESVNICREWPRRLLNLPAVRRYERIQRSLGNVFGQMGSIRLHES